MFPAKLVYIDEFRDEVDILQSKEKPRKLRLKGSDGREYTFLCKKEVKGDMRKNSRMMDFNSVVNRLLRVDNDTRSRHLALRTFSVLAMTEESGLIEWVQHTAVYRTIINDLHSAQGVKTNFGTLKVTYKRIEDCRGSPSEREKEMKSVFASVCHQYPPVFHRWFTTRFRDPTSW